MPDGRDSGLAPIDATQQAQRVADRLFGSNDMTAATPGAAIGPNALDLLRQQVLGRPSPWGDGTTLPGTPAPGGSDRLPLPTGSDSPPQNPAPVRNGVLEVNYGDPDFDAKLAQNNYSKLVIQGLPKDLTPAPWVDESGKGFFFWLKNPKNPDASDRSKHYFPANLKTIEIAQYAGNIYKPVMVNVDEMRIAASQAYMRAQNDSGFASYSNTTDVVSYAKNMAGIAGQSLAYEEKLLREGASTSPSNPYFHIYLADVLAAQAIQPVVQDMLAGKQVYFDNDYTNAKLAEAIKETQAAQMITQRYGNRVKPPDYVVPLSPFALNPYSYNPDYYWSGAYWQSAQREVQLTMLSRAIKLGKIPFELPPALPPKQ